MTCFPGKEGKKLRSKVKKIAKKVEEDEFEEDLEMVGYDSGAETQESLSSGFRNRSVTNQTVQPQKMAEA